MVSQLRFARIWLLGFCVLLQGGGGLNAPGASNELSVSTVLKGGTWPGFFGGFPYGVHIVNDKAYVILNHGLAVFETSHGTNFVQVGEYLIEGFARRGAVAFPYVYIADGDYGVHVLDVSNPREVRRVGGLVADDAFDVKVVGNRLYVAAWPNGFHIADISDPSNPLRLGGYDTTGYVARVEVAGEYLFATHDDELQIYNIANPASPTFVSEYKSGVASDSVRHVEVAGSYAYVGMSSSGLRVLDISNPTTPQLAGNVATRGSVDTVRVRGNYAYLSDARLGLLVADVTNPHAPRLVATGTVASASSLTISDTHVYVNSYDDRIHCFDVTSPASPVFRFALKTLNKMWSVYTAGSVALAHGFSEELSILDIREPHNIKRVAMYSNATDITAVEVKEATLYLGDNGGGLTLLDLSQPNNPSVIKRYRLSDSVEDLKIVGSYAYLANGYNGLRIIDVSDPMNLFIVGQHPPDFYAAGVEVADGKAYLQEWGAVTIMDVTDPSDPTLLTSELVADLISSIQVRPPFLFVADESIGLYAYHMSNNTNIVQVGFYPMDAYLPEARIVGNFGFLASDELGVQVVDVSDPTNMVVVARQDTRGYASGIAIGGNGIYVADNFNGVVGIPYIPGVCMSVQASGDGGSSLSIQANNNLANASAWTNVFTINAPRMPVGYLDFDVQGVHKFYRAIRHQH